MTKEKLDQFLQSNPLFKDIDNELPVFKILSEGYSLKFELFRLIPCFIYAQSYSSFGTNNELYKNCRNVDFVEERSNDPLGSLISINDVFFHEGNFFVPIDECQIEPMFLKKLYLVSKDKKMAITTLNRKASILNNNIVENFCNFYNRILTLGYGLASSSSDVMNLSSSKVAFTQQEILSLKQEGCLIFVLSLYSLIVNNQKSFKNKNLLLNKNFIRDLINWYVNVNPIYLGSLIKSKLNQKLIYDGQYTVEGLTSSTVINFQAMNDDLIFNDFYKKEISLKPVDSMVEYRIKIKKVKDDESLLVLKHYYSPGCNDQYGHWVLSFRDSDEILFSTFPFESDFRYEKKSDRSKAETTIEPFDPKTVKSTCGLFHSEFYHKDLNYSIYISNLQPFDPLISYRIEFDSDPGTVSPEIKVVKTEIKKSNTVMDHSLSSKDDVIFYRLDSKQKSPLPIKEVILDTNEGYLV